MKRSKTSSRAMRQRTTAETQARGDSKYARKYWSGKSMYCKRNQRLAAPVANVSGIEELTS